MHHGFWNYFDKEHVQYEPGNPYENAIPEYYKWIDDQIGTVLPLLDKDTVVLVVSDHGAQRLDGGLAVNEWLVKEGLLVLDEYPKEVTPFSKLKINWAKTKVWSEGGYYARVFFNVKGREPQGIIAESEYNSFQDEMKKRFEGLQDDKGRPLNSLVFKPKEIYKSVRNVPPDLIVHFGGLYWRSIGSVGYGHIHVQENDTGPDACNHAQYGMFLLSAPNCSLRGEFQGAKLLDIAPTLLGRVRRTERDARPFNCWKSKVSVFSWNVRDFRCRWRAARCHADPDFYEFVSQLGAALARQFCVPASGPFGAPSRKLCHGSSSGSLCSFLDFDTTVA
jgi:predicted AlkP superfamily phosphohydrolase/phosphomutase